MKITHIDDKGYRVFNDSGRYVHRWKGETKYGKEKIKGKDIHHIDSDKTNNQYSNLILLNKEDHYNLTQYENRKKVILSIIIGLSLFYLITINLVNYTKLLNYNIAVSLARISVFIILFLALELKYNWLRRWIRNPKSKKL